MNHLHKIFLIRQTENSPIINQILYRLIVRMFFSFQIQLIISLFCLFLVDSEIDCNNCIVDVDSLFCDKHTFLPCIEPEV